MAKQTIIHDSFHSYYRFPFGAVCSEEEITIRIKVARTHCIDYMKLHLHKDYDENEQFFMSEVEQDENEVCYEVVFNAPKRPQLLWYYFEFSENNRVYYYGKQPDNYGGCGHITDHIPLAYQITVHHPNAETPNWMKESIIYQIFVDRFYNGNEDGKILNKKKNSLIHSHWDNEPLYIKDEKGAVIRWDFFGGNLLGVIKKLPYLKSFGVSIIYFNPIFEASSNHKYDTGDYHKIDPMFGDIETFRTLIEEAKKFGIKIILDGVFSHTGSDSIYFNREGNYDSVGAYQSKDSPYYDWYIFHEFPDNYESWWGIGVLPNVNELNPSYQNFIIDDENSVLKTWMREGIIGWRLDVADELPPEFLKKFYKVMKEENRNAILIGEVWEDASNKVSYGIRREYLLGEELDSVMNYPFRKILLDFALNRTNSETTHRALMTLYENYPRHHFYSMMNLIGSHDVARALTELSANIPNDISEAERKQIATKRLKMLVAWQMTFPGVPSIYYGDEAGLTGGVDPDNRKPFPWGRENKELVNWHKELTSLRNAYPMFKTGEWHSLYFDSDIYGYVRMIKTDKDVFGQKKASNTALVLFNRSFHAKELTIDVSEWFKDEVYDFIADENCKITDGKLTIVLNGLESKIYIKDRFPEESFSNRKAGLLLHVTSLPSKFGIGNLGQSAYEFVDFLSKSKQKYWQMLPIHPVDSSGSPYQSDSAFAGNYLLIDPMQLYEEGLITEQDIKRIETDTSSKVDYSIVAKNKQDILKKAYQSFKKKGMNVDYEQFINEHAYWLNDYSLYMAIKEQFNGKPWSKWPKRLAKRNEKALSEMRNKLRETVEYYQFVQYVFFSQWNKLKQYAEKKNVHLIGDIPIFVAHDSCDVWVNRHLFDLDEDGNSKTVAGVPPDYFSETGQRWGNPLYLWEEMKKDGYSWWKNRIIHLAKLVDVVRIDHFRGFEAYWAIPAEEETAVRGQWKKGPNEHFFETLRDELKEVNIIAEDLGIITPEVEQLKDRYEFPGMKVMQFLPRNENDNIAPLRLYERNNILYTGTHDNETLVQWIKEKLPDIDDVEGKCLSYIEEAYRSYADTVIIPVQDILCLDASSRMNTPGTTEGNWEWKLRGEELSDELARKLQQFVKKYKR